jgi:hypothetical protein
MLSESDDDQTRARAIRSGLLVHKVQTASALGWTATEGRDLQLDDDQIRRESNDNTRLQEAMNA